MKTIRNKSMFAVIPDKSFFIRPLFSLMAPVLLLVLISGCDFNGSDETGHPVGKNLISAYRIKSGPVKITGAFNNVSGITYSPVTDSLFVIINAPTKIIEIDKDGSQKRIIILTGFSDTEGIAHVEKDLFAIAQEGNGRLSLVRIDKNTKSINSSEAEQVVVEPGEADNKGIEGVCYDAQDRRFYIVKEKYPRKIYSLGRDEIFKDKPEISLPWSLERKNHGMSDVSGVYFRQKDKTLLLLSHESARVVQCKTNGLIISTLLLGEGDAGLLQAVPQAEGITMDGESNLYICSEPDLFYVFDKALNGNDPR